MQMPTTEWISYAVYAAILVMFFIVLKLPKKKKGEQSEKKKFVSTSKKFNKDNDKTEDQNSTKDI